MDVKKATNTKNINDDGHSVFGWGGLIYSFSRGASLNLALVTI
jgi:hypothetical protein